MQKVQIGRWRMRVTERLYLDSSPESPRNARRFVSGQAAEWGYDHILPAVELLTSEVVTNAVLHAEGTAIEVEVADLADGLLVGVADHASDAEPTPRLAKPTDPTGRGLTLVDALASSWGVSQVPDDGKVVWFRISA